MSFGRDRTTDSQTRWSARSMGFEIKLRGSHDRTAMTLKNTGNTEPNSGFLAGVRVLELSDEMGEYCGRVLAGLGADVVKVEPAAGERTRQYGPFIDDCFDPEGSLYFWQYNFGKRGVVLESQNDSDSLARLIAAADIVIDARMERSLHEDGFTEARLREIAPELILLRITPFGEDGPWAGYQGSDLVHLALGGVMMNCGYDAQPNGHYDTPPIAPQMWQAYHIAGEMGLIAILGALQHRLSTGEGQRLSLAVHEAVAKNTELDLPNWIYSRTPHSRQTCRHSLPAGDKRFDLPWITMTKDGRWLNPYRTYLQRGAAAGPDLLAQMLDLFVKNGQDIGLPVETLTSADNRDLPQFRSHVNQLTDRFAAGFVFERDIWRDAQAVGLPWAPLRRPEENLAEEHWAERGTFTSVDHPEYSRQVTYVTGRWVCDSATWRVGPRAPRLGEHTAEVLAEWEPREVLRSKPLGQATSLHRTPFALAGLKIVDLSWMVASGGSGRFLACMGADVVKVEHHSRVDATRLSYGRAPMGGREERDAATEPIVVDGGLNRSGFFMDMCAGKRSLSLDLKSERGREILTQMIAEADIVIEGFSPGTMARMGFGYDRLREINPKIIYIQQSGLGEKGTYGSVRTYGPTAQGFSGLSEMSGLPEPFPPAGIGYSYLDWFGAYNMATAMLAALYRRRLTGRGCYVDSSQVETGLYLTGTAILDYTANGRRWSRTGNLAPHQKCAPHGAYRTTGVDRWIAVSCFGNDQWMALCDVLGLDFALANPNFATSSSRYERRAEVDAIMSEAVAEWDAYELMIALQKAGVPAGVCQNTQDRYESDPQLRHLEWLVELPQSEIGTWPVKEFPVTFSRTPTYMGGQVGRSGPNYGEDNEAVLSELGLSDTEIANLRRDGVL